MSLLTDVADSLEQDLDPRLAWRQIARPDQLLPPLDQPWRVAFWRGGRGSGKTRTCAQALAELVLSDTDGEGEYGVIAPTYADAWTKCVEGESGLLRALGTSMAEVKDHRSVLVRSAWRTYGQVVMNNGITIYVDSANDGALRVQGRNLKAVWCDEIGLWEKWQIAWNESIRYAVRHGWSKIICDGTPKASRPARELVRSMLRDAPEHGGVITRRLRTIDNIDNLSPEFYRSVVGAAKGTRLERQELEGELLDDVANALWTRALIESIQVPPVGEEGGPPHLRQAIIGVDPSDGAEDSDEQAYTVAGFGAGGDPHVYVAENWGGQMAPAAFARKVILKAVEWNARIVVERNHGGGWLKSTFTQVMKELKEAHLLGPDNRAPWVEMIWASQAKRTRAEPVSALYERGLVRHCYKITRYTRVDPDTGRKTLGVDRESMSELEDQMCTFTGAARERSPDRLDSLVWACTPFLDKTFGPDVPATRARYALDAGVDFLDGIEGGTELAPIPEPGEHPGRRRLSPAAKHQWDLDSFAPGGDDEPAERSVANVVSWR